MLNMTKDSAITSYMFVFTCMCLVNYVNCLSSSEARTLNKKFELMRNGFDNKLVSALIQIDDIRESVRNCSCREPNVTVTAQAQTFVERPSNGIRDDKPARSRFAKQNQTKIEVRGGWTDWAPWEQCSHTCGIGLSLRKRECTNPNPGSHGNPCHGEFTDVKICMLQECQDGVHGGWTDWAPWEQCSVTCGIGLSSRKRECSNPSPGPRGNPCIGEYTDVKICMIKECLQLGPNGGWSDWTEWGQCSKTCGTGIIKRERYCSNPYPGPYGNPCVGYNMDVDICMLKECPSVVYGGWANWTQWGECSQTCGTGLMQRSRQCSNPYPGPYGTPCFGDFTDIQQCVLQECTHVDGGWSDWTSWSTCSVTCNGGLKTRDRNCNNPKPSLLGRYCDGRNMDCQSCRTNTCPDPIVFFSVRDPRDWMVNDVVVFTDKVDTSSDNGYSTTTGKFTCRIPGLYHFAVTFLSHLKSGSDSQTYCHIRKNNVVKTVVSNSAFGKSGSNYNRRSASASVYLSLDTGDTVWVGGCGGWDNIRKYPAFHLVGALITAS